MMRKSTNPVNKLDFLPKDDLSWFLRAQKLMEAWYVLSNEDISVVLDSVKPRILQVFAHGRFGRLQQLIYDTNGHKRYAGLWGIVPAYYLEGKRFLPFIHDDRNYEDNRPEAIDFDEQGNRIRLSGIRCFSENGEESKGIDLEVSLEGNRVRVSVSYPQEVERGEISSVWYPFYTDYYGEAKEGKRDIDYFTDGYNDGYYDHPGRHFDRIVGGELNLVDRFGRLPGLRIKSENGLCRLISQCDPQRGNAFRLQVFVETKGDDEVTFELLPNPVIVKVNPLVAAGKQVTIEVLSEEKPEVLLDGRKVQVKGDRGQFLAEAKAKEGKHTVEARTSLGKSLGYFWALGDPIPKLLKMGQAATRLPWKKPPLENIVPYFYYLDGPEPALRVGMSYCSHSLRVFPIMVAASLISEYRKYVDRAFQCLEALAGKAHQFENGDLLLAIILDKEGKPARQYLNGCRPSDLGIMVRAFLYTYRGFKHFGDEEKAGKCLNYALRYASTLLRMQEEDGGFFPRYKYPTLEPTPDGEPKGTVNNWAVQIWELADILKQKGRPEARILREIVLKHIDYLLNKRNLLRVTGGGEDQANNMDSLATAATYLTMKYLSTRDEQYRRYAEDAFKMAACRTTIYIDQPQNYFFATHPGEAHYSNQPDGLLCKGGMHDLTLGEAGLFLKKYLGFEFGGAVASCGFADRLADSVLDNGAMYGAIIDVPNYHYRREDGAETLNYGAVGGYGYHYVAQAR